MDLKDMILVMENYKGRSAWKRKNTRPDKTQFPL